MVHTNNLQTISQNTHRQWLFLYPSRTVRHIKSNISVGVYNYVADISNLPVSDTDVSVDIRKSHVGYTFWEIITQTVMSYRRVAC
jgi:hypothetical protein